MTADEAKRDGPGRPRLYGTRRRRCFQLSVDVADALRAESATQEVSENQIAERILRAHFFPDRKGPIWDYTSKRSGD